MTKLNRFLAAGLWLAASLLAWSTPASAHFVTLLETYNADLDGDDPVPGLASSVAVASTRRAFASATVSGSSISFTLKLEGGLTASDVSGVRLWNNDGGMPTLVGALSANSSSPSVTLFSNTISSSSAGALTALRSGDLWIDVTTPVVLGGELKGSFQLPLRSLLTGTLPIPGFVITGWVTADDDPLNFEVGYQVESASAFFLGQGAPSAVLFDGNPSQGGVALAPLTPDAPLGFGLAWRGTLDEQSAPGLRAAYRAQRLWIRVTPLGGAIYESPLRKGLLNAYQDTVSNVLGGSQALEVTAGPSSAFNFYAVVGSLSGTGPTLLPSGSSFLGGTLGIPLSLDAYTNLTLANPAGSPLTNAFGLLDVEGRALARFDLAPGALNINFPLDLWHSVLEIDALSGTVRRASDAVPLTVTPF
ncbi:MAG: hypothetical protein AAFZ65_03980 [Planctomycetota bacterium]